MITPCNWCTCNDCGECSRRFAPAPEAKPTRLEVGGRYRGVIRGAVYNEAAVEFEVLACEGTVAEVRARDGRLLGYAKAPGAEQPAKQVTAAELAAALEDPCKKAALFPFSAKAAVKTLPRVFDFIPRISNADQIEALIADGAPRPAQPVRRSVSEDGKHWSPWDPSSPFPFEDFKHRREDGVRAATYDRRVERAVSVYRRGDGLMTVTYSPAPKPDPGRAETVGDLAGAAAAALVTRPGS